MITVDRFLKKRGIKIVAEQGIKIDVTMSNGKLIFGTFAVPAKFEKELIS